jgi:hypothetical protein
MDIEQIRKVKKWIDLAQGWLRYALHYGDILMLSLGGLYHLGIFSRTEEIPENFDQLDHQQLKLELKLIYDRRSVGQSVLVPSSHLEPMTRFLFSA